MCKLCLDSLNACVICAVFGSRDPNLYGQWHCHTLTKVGESFTAYSECSDDIFQVPILTLSLTFTHGQALKLFIYQFPSSTSSGLELICKKLAIVWCSLVGSCYHWPLTNQKLLSLRRSSYLLNSHNHAALNFPSFLQIKNCTIRL